MRSGGARRGVAGRSDRPRAAGAAPLADPILNKG